MMTIVASVFAALIALIHVYVFYLESIAWGKPKTNKMFRVTPEQAELNRVFAFNQGFYNLFIAIAIVAGLVMNTQVLIDYGALSVLGAGVVLILSGPGRARAASIQIVPAVIYFALRFLA